MSKNDMIHKIQMKWTKLSRSAIHAVLGDMRGLTKIIQEAYGITRDHAEREYHDFQLTLRPALQPILIERVNPGGSKRKFYDS